MLRAVRRRPEFYRDAGRGSTGVRTRYPSWASAKYRTAIRRGFRIGSHEAGQEVVASTGADHSRFGQNYRPQQSKRTGPAIPRALAEGELMKMTGRKTLSSPVPRGNPSRRPSPFGIATARPTAYGRKGTSPAPKTVKTGKRMF